MNRFGNIRRPCSLAIRCITVLTVLWLCLVPPAFFGGQPPDPPPNDFFTNPQPINGGSGLIPGNLIGATAEVGEPTARFSVWYRWTPPTNGTYAFSVGSGDQFQGQVRVYSGAGVTSLTLHYYFRLFTRPDVPGTITGPYFLEVASPFHASTGMVYHIQVDAWRGQPGPFSLAWDPSFVTNDYLHAATAIRGRTGSIAGPNDGATREPGEPEALTGGHAKRT